MKTLELYGSDYLSSESDDSDSDSTSSFDSDNSLESDNGSKSKQLKVKNNKDTKTNKKGGFKRIRHTRIPEATRRIMNIMNSF